MALEITTSASYHPVSNGQVSVKSHLTSGVFMRPENNITYSMGNKGGDFFGHCRHTPLLTLQGTAATFHALFDGRAF